MCAALCLTVSSATLPLALKAQPSSGRPTPVASTTAVSIGEMFVTAPMQPMLVPAPVGESCGVARCFRGLITVRANQRWQLQVRVDPTVALMATVAWRPPVAAGQELRLDGSWTTVLAGPIPTAGTDVALQFSVTSSGPSAEGGEPFAQLVSLAVQYRVIALP